MLDNLPILSMIIFSPLIGILILLFIRSEQGKIIKMVGISTTFIPLLLSIWLFANFNIAESSLQFQENLSWIKIPLNIEGIQQINAFFIEFKYLLGVDGLSIGLIFLTALICAMASLSSIYIKKRWKSFYILFLVLEIGIFGVFTAQDLFLFFIFFELTIIPMFFLIGIWGNMEKEKAAIQFLIYNGIGSAIMFIAFLIIIVTAGFQVSDVDPQMISYSGNLQNITFNLFQNPEAFVNQQGEGNPFYLSEQMKWILFTMLLIAFGIKLPIFPFHSWMLKVHAQAPASIVMIHSGLLLKMGAYGLIKFGILLFPAEVTKWAWVIALLGIINILYGAILAFVQTDLRLVLAFSSISHMGIVLIGLASLHVVGIQGAIYQLISHGLISALMFLMVGIIYERTQTLELDQLGGLAKSIPFVSAVLLFAGLASLGLPGLSGFIAEFLSFLGLFEKMKIYAVIGTLGIILAAVYVLRAILKITFGNTRENHLELKDARFIEAIPMITLVAFIVLLGIYPSVLMNPILPTVENMNDFLANFSKRMGG
jgi:NADH-quinone oxidoreductase subunit M